MTDRPFNPLFILEVIPRLLSFFPVTLMMMAGTIVLGSLLGFILARAKVRGTGVGSALARGYTMLMRCTPPIVLLFIVYYGVPELLMAVAGVDINSYAKSFFVIFTLTLLFAATISEVMRSAYQAVDKGQREAAVSMGLSETQAFLRITFPQALAVALPTAGTSVIALMKDGALAYTIGLIDMMGQGTLVIARNFGAYGLETYLALALVYWFFTIIIERTFLVVENRLSRGRRPVAS